MSKLWTAMLEAQKEIKHVIKDSKNPHLKNTYASLGATIDAIKPILNKNGLVLWQRVSGGPQCVFVTTAVVHAETGETTENDSLPIPVKHKFNKEGVDVGPDAQELGSAITYGRRYGLQSVFSIASEDDDGESAVNGSKPGLERKTDVQPSSGSAPISVEDKAKLQSNMNKALGWKPLNG